MAFTKFTAVAMPEPQYVANVCNTKAWEYSKQCDLANRQNDEEKALKYANLAIKAAGYPEYKEARANLGLNVVYYYYDYGFPTD